MEFIKHIHFSKEIEVAILGSCIIEPEAFGRTFGITEADNFYFEENKMVYESLALMYNDGLPIDIFTVTDYIINKKDVLEINSNSVSWFICQLTNSVVSSANLEYYCYVIKRMWMERELLKLTHGGLQLEGEVKEQIQQLSTAIQKVNQGVYKNDWNDMSQIMYDLMQHQEQMSKTKGKGITTGIRSLDGENGGFFEGQMIVIGARPSVGKSAFMGQMAISMAKENVSVCIISLEMNNNEIGARLSSLHTQEDFKVIFRNLYNDENHRGSWYDKIRSLVQYPIYISDVTGVNIVDIKAKAQKLKSQLRKEGKEKMILMIDYLQLVNAEENQRNRTRENEVSKISRGVKLMAKELGIPVIILCQLNRAVTQRKGQGRYPQLSDLRESGSIEQDADIVMFLHRDWMMGEEFMKDENGESTENKADLIIRKWRNGANNLHIPLIFDAPKMMFRQTDNVERWKPESLPNVDYTQDNPF